MADATAAAAAAIAVASDRRFTLATRLRASSAYMLFTEYSAFCASIQSWISDSESLCGGLPILAAYLCVWDKKIRQSREMFLLSVNAGLSVVTPHRIVSLATGSGESDSRDLLACPLPLAAPVAVAAASGNSSPVQDGRLVPPFPPRASPRPAEGAEGNSDRRNVAPGRAGYRRLTRKC